MILARWLPRRVAGQASAAAIVCCATGMLAGTSVQAQEPVALQERLPIACTGQRISNVIVLTQPPYTDRLPDWADFVRRGMVRFHANTKDEVVRQYLLLEAGDACSEIERTESERILRAQPFLVDARVRAFADGEGGVELEVETRDEFSGVAGIVLNGKSPMLRGLTLGESNLAGQGIYSALSWRDGGAYDDLYGARIVDHQFMGQRNIARLFGERAQRGHEYGAELLRPYYTDLQRLAWHTGYGGRRDYVRLVRDDEPNLGLSYQRDFGDIGAVFRVGEPGRMKLLGMSLTHEQEQVGARPVVVDVGGFRDDSLAGDFPQFYREARVTRINALAGMRRVSFMRVEGFDALTGVQDVRAGIQSGVTLGRSLGVLNGRDRDLFLRYDVYVGGGSPSSFVGLEALTEARRDSRTRTWDGIITGGRLAWYFKPWRNQLTLSALDWGGGWNVRVPYQLTFADREGGMLGYRKSRASGAHRAVLRVEQRWLPTPRTTIGDLGVALFADVGKLWAGDVPYASTSKVRGTVGIGVLAAVPRRSRRLWRLDFGLPVGGDPNASFEVRISSADRTRTLWLEPVDMSYARERAVPRSLFSWP